VGTFDAIALEAEETLRSESLTVSEDDREALARRLVERVGWPYEHAEELLAAAGLQWREADLPAPFDALYVPSRKLILVARGLKAARRRYALLHELAHALSPSDATHADVFLLSLSLAHPPQQIESVRSSGVDPTAQDLYDGSTPSWCAVLRLRYRK